MTDYKWLVFCVSLVLYNAGRTTLG